MGLVSSPLFVVLFSMSVLLISMAYNLSLGYEQDFASEFTNGSTWHNVAGNVQCRPKAFHQPSTEAELISIVKSYPHVKVVGAAHSFSPLATVPEDGALVNLDRYNAFLKVEVLPDGSKVAIVQAGIRIYQLDAALAARGLAISTRGAISRQSLAGVLSTATHGSSLHHGCVSSLVTRMRLIDGKGGVMEVDASHYPDVFNAARVGLGVIGIISTVTLQVEDEFYLYRDEHGVPVEDVLVAGEQLAREKDYFFWYWVPLTGIAKTFTWTRVPKEQMPGGVWYLVQRFFQATAIRAEAAFAAVFANNPGYIYSFYGVAGHRANVSNVLVGESSHIMEVNTLPDLKFDVEYYVPVARCKEVFDAFRGNFTVDLAKHHNIVGVFTVRYVKGDDIWMSPFYKTDTCAFDVFSSKGDGHKPEFLEFVHTLFSKFNASSHPGKMNHLDPEV